MIKRVLLATSIALSGTAVSFAADMPVKARSVVSQQGYDWTGAYLGMSIGGVFGSSQWTDVTTGGSGGSFNGSGLLIGGTAGYNFQMNNIVLGVEADASSARFKGSTTASCGTNACETSSSYLYTVRSRLGLAYGNLLPYITGGLAVGDIKGVWAGSPRTDQSTSKSGWVMGTGVEWGFARNWSTKVEYLYTDLGTATVGTGANTDRITLKENVVRAGVNYRF